LNEKPFQDFGAQGSCLGKEEGRERTYSPYPGRFKTKGLRAVQWLGGVIVQVSDWGGD